MVTTISENTKNITYFSPNMLKLFKSCPAKFYYRYVKQIPMVSLDKNFSTGKNIHALASYYLNGTNIEKFENSLNEKEKIIWNNLKNINYFLYEKISIEKDLMLRLGDFWIGGRIDAIVKNKTDYYILDYKTGGVENDMTYDFQTMIYLLLCDSFYKNYENLYFVYIDLKNNSEVKIEFNKELKEEYQKILSDTYNKIINFDISKYHKKTDCNCEYINLCKHEY